MARQYDLTAVGISPAADRAHRMRTYFIAMSVRVACVASLFFVRGWWILLVGAGAVLLPYFAVLIANQAEHRASTRPEPPSPLELGGSAPAGPPHSETSASDHFEPAVSETVLIVDAPAERRSSARASDTAAPNAASAAHDVSDRGADA